jgi:hypothetical protein
MNGIVNQTVTQDTTLVFPVRELRVRITGGTGSVRLIMFFDDMN